ncbi:unnamed protein product [Closterium sp. NIES-65]|nr:unnamed protein product [Closterium sp. NIES-65]
MDGTPAPVQWLEHLEVLLVVAGLQQGLLLCRVLQGSEAALEPQEFDDTGVLNEERLGAAGEAAGAIAGGGGGSAGEKWPERVGGGASAEEQGGTGGERTVARDMWMTFGEEFKMLPRQGMDSSMWNS